MTKEVRVQNNSPRNIWVLIDENTKHLAESDTKVVGETEFELYYKYVMEGNIKCPIEGVPIEAGSKNEQEFKTRLKTHWESAAKETYVWSGFVKAGEVEVQPRKANVWALKSDEDIYYISVRSNGTIIANAMSRRDSRITIDETGHINDEPAARVAIANKQAVSLHFAKDQGQCVGDPKTGVASNWDAGTFGNTAGSHELHLVGGADLKNGSAVRIKSKSNNLQDQAFSHMYCSEVGWVYYDTLRDSGRDCEKQQWILSKTSATGNSSGDELCFGDTVVISNRFWKDANLGFKDKWLECTRGNATEWLLKP
jgi:hypothetical protein